MQHGGRRGIGELRNSGISGPRIFEPALTVVHSGEVFSYDQPIVPKFFGGRGFFDPWPRRSSPSSFLPLRTQIRFELFAKGHYGPGRAIEPEEDLHDPQGPIFERLKSPGLA